MVAAVFLIVSTVSSVVGIVASAMGVNAGDPVYLQSAVFGAFTWAVWSFLLGTLVFLMSLGLSGWVYSKRLGWVSSTAAAATMAAILVFLNFVVDAF